MANFGQLFFDVFMFIYGFLSISPQQFICWGVYVLEIILSSKGETTEQ